MKPEELIRRYQTLKSDRETWDTLYQEVCDYFLPYQGDFDRLYSPAEKRNRELYSQVPQHAVDITSSSLIGLIANPASRWFYIEMVDEELNRRADVADWCESQGQVLLNYINQPDTRFYQSLKTALADALVTGTPSMYCNRSDETGIEFGAKTVHSFVIAEDHRGIVDTVINEMKMTVRQVMQKVEEDEWQSHDALEKIAKEKPDKEIDVLHFIMPRADAKEGKLNPKVLPIAGYYVDKTHNKILKETGYNEMPQPVARWITTVNEKYGRSQAMIALADAQTLNVAMRMFLIAMEKEIQPNVFLPHDSNPDNIDLTAGGVTYYDAAKGRPEFYSGNGQLGIVFEFIQDLENKIRTTMYVDQLQLAGGADMTATEVLQRQNEKARLIAPAMGRFQAELLTPLVTRAFNIGIRDGWIKAPPADVVQQDYKVSYATPITRAQRDVDLDNILAALGSVGQIAQFDPRVLDNVDSDKIAAEIMDIRGVTGVMKRDEQEVEQTRAAAAEQQQAQQLIQQAQEGANVAKTANEAGVLKDVL